MKVIDSKTKVYFGAESLKVLGQMENERIMLVADKFLVDNHIVDKVIKEIKPSNHLCIFSKVIPDPPLEVVSELISEIVKENMTVMIAFGGGSSIDTAKGAIYFMHQANMQDKVYFVAIPTTSGTGSEVSSFTVITDRDEKVKHSFNSNIIQPDVAILDSEFTRSLPKQVVANTGIDVLTHAIEAYVAKNANPYSDALSEKAGELVVKNLVIYYLDQTNKEAGENMHIASTLAGMSFNNAGLGINHSIAHQIGGQFHIPHGHANGLLLNEVMNFNARDEKILKKYAKYAKKIGIARVDFTDMEAFANLKTYITCIQKMMKMELTLGECGITGQQIQFVMEDLCRHALEDNCTKTAAHIPTKQEIKEIVQKIL